MDEFPNTNGYSFSWTQPYNISASPFYQSRHLSIDEEIAKIEMVDRWVDSMLTYPDAEAILKKIKEAKND